MIDQAQATAIAEENFPDGEIQAVVNYNGKWVFSIFSDDPLEGQLDPFYSVDETTGAFDGFAIAAQDRPADVLELFDATIKHAAFLEHFGVKGMKWGVLKKDDGGKGSPTRNADGTPTKFSTGAEAGLNLIKPIASMKIPVGVGLQSKVMQVAALVAGQAQVPLKVALKTSFISPAAIVGYALGAADSGAYRVPGMVVKNSLRGGWPTNRELAKVPMSLKDIQSKVVKGVNPQFPGLGTTNNCLRATYTYEMRRRGFDVTATKTMMATGQNANGTRIMTGKLKVGTQIDASAKAMRGNSAMANIVNKVVKKRPTANDVYHALSQQPNGSRGDLQMRWGMGGHSVAYEIIKGRPVVIDAQSGKTYSNPKELDDLVGPAISLKFNRLDDKNLNEFAMTAWVKDADSAKHSALLDDFLSQYIEIAAL